MPQRSFRETLHEVRVRGQRKKDYEGAEAMGGHHRLVDRNWYPLYAVQGSCQRQIKPQALGYHQKQQPMLRGHRVYLP